MCNVTPSAVFHVSPDITPETRHALEEMARVVAQQHGHQDVSVGYVIRTETPFDADYLHDTEAFDA